ncbi:BTAD domain-containing putative transcriptional regulator [Actinokineospora soli]|uniref:BTAD domain-containing putative transcriptional regulator n=1 Tax=Actinokineospora soli TaxID=1048753 RepID=A0ABW2TML6_9PSEU
MLGPLAAWHGSIEVNLGDQQQRFILAVLLLNANKPVSPEKLTDVVWDGNLDRRKLVRGYISRMRIAFRDADDVVIEKTPTGYVLRVDPDKIDTNRFDRLREAALRTDDPLRAIELLREAVDLWRGEFLEDIDIDRIGGTSVTPPTDRYLDAVRDLAELELDAGDARSARDRLRRVVWQDAADQRSAELLMRALIASGDGTGAIRVFRETEKALADEDMEPGPALRKLAARAERGEPAASLPGVPGFVGRDRELAAVDAAAATPGEQRAVWVTGPPGVGKTGLAVEAAHRMRDRFPDGQLLVRLNGYAPNAPATTVSDALTQLLRELGVPPEQIPATDAHKAALYQAELYGTKRLVVLDNAASPEQVRLLLPVASGCFAIVTSRQDGEVGAGRRIRLEPLPPADAASLFTAFAKSPARTNGRADEVAEVVRRCGYLPMPVLVAAALFARHDRWPLEHLLRLLAESGPWSADGAAAVRVSYQQLGHRQREVFGLLGHVPGPDIDVRAAAPSSAATSPRPARCSTTCTACACSRRSPRTGTACSTRSATSPRPRRPGRRTRCCACSTTTWSP